MIKEITSTNNSRYKEIKSLKMKKSRMKLRKYTVEGIKSVRDAICASADIDYIAVSEKLNESFDCENVYVVSEKIFSGLCDTETPQGVIAVINMPEEDKHISEDRLYLLCDRVTDPGNMGTIIRICDAVGCGILLLEGTVDIYNPKTVRASMGSFFHTKVISQVKICDILKMKADGYRLLSGALSDKTQDFREADWNGKVIVAVGNEANGISDEILKISDSCVKIPILGKAESLNVGVAAALLLYEAIRNNG